MSASPAELIGRLGSADFNERAKALAALVGQGRAATPDVVAALDGADAEVRPQLARALAEIADPGTADTLVALTGDEDADVRSQAAVGLARIRDPRAVDALARTIDDLPDLTHHPYTLSVYGLIDIGKPALAAVAPLLSADDPMTRLRAFVVLRTIVSSLDEAGDWDALSDAVGRYDPDADPADRDAAAAQWAAWIREHG